MQFTYKMKRHRNSNVTCEIRTQVPGAHILIKVNSWTPSIDMSMNGAASIRLENLEEITAAIREARVKIDDL